MRTEERVLTQFTRIAVVGISDNPGRPSFGVSRYLMDHGYIVIPVNPNLETWRGLRVYPDLESAPPPVEVVDVFRRSDAAGDVVDQAIRIGAKAVWLQEGVMDEDAAERARQAGLLVVMDRCILKEHARLHIGS